MKRLTISQEFGELGKDYKGEWLWNFEHDDEIEYGLQQLFVGSFLVFNDGLNQEIKLY
jgi:hypothetical protein